MVVEPLEVSQQVQLRLSSPQSVLVAHLGNWVPDRVVLAATKLRLFAGSAPWPHGSPVLNTEAQERRFAPNRSKRRRCDILSGFSSERSTPLLRFFGANGGNVALDNVAGFSRLSEKRQ